MSLAQQQQFIAIPFGFLTEKESSKMPDRAELPVPR
jgi:hypothetical protein